MPPTALAGEDRLLAWLTGRLAGGDGAPPLIGDDAAVLPAGGPWAVTIDSQIAGVHVPPDLDSATLARRLLAVNLSDLAATGADPAYAFLALAAPPGFAHRRFFDAFLDACREPGLELAGGDLARAPAVTATLALLGRRPRGGHFLSRRGARPGYRLWLGGTVGESAAGQLLVAHGARLRGARVALPGSSEIVGWPRPVRAAAARAVARHLAPAPQLELGRWLGRRRAPVAAMDVSDGLARDLPRLCRASGAGAVVHAEALPLAPGFASLCAALGSDPVALALGGGEDYVLLFTLPDGMAPPPHFGCAAIGTITEDGETIVIERDGVRRPLPDLGWDHLRT